MASGGITTAMCLTLCADQKQQKSRGLAGPRLQNLVEEQATREWAHLPG